MLTKMLVATLILFVLSALNGYASEKKREANCTLIVGADLRFAAQLNTELFHHVLAVNALGEHRRIDGVVLATDLFDNAPPKLLDFYRQRWERGADYRQIHYDTFPTFATLDGMAADERPAEMRIGMEFNLHYLDSMLLDMKNAGRILAIHRSSRSYSFDLGGVHFVCGQLAAGDTTYGESNMQWIAADLRRYAIDGRPVVYVQHYGFDAQSRERWSEAQRAELFDILEQYNLAAVFVGYTPNGATQRYRDVTIHQMPNMGCGVEDRPLFDVLQIKGRRVTVERFAIVDNEGRTERVEDASAHATIA